MDYRSFGNQDAWENPQINDASGASSPDSFPPSRRGPSGIKKQIPSLLDIKTHAPAQTPIYYTARSGLKGSSQFPTSNQMPLAVDDLLNKLVAQGVIQKSSQANQKVIH